MPTRWFIIPPVSIPDDPGDTSDGPKYVIEQGLSSAGHAIQFNGNRRYIVQVRGTQTELDNLASQNDVVAPPESDVETQLNEKTGKNLTFTEWSDRFIAGNG